MESFRLAALFLLLMGPFTVQGKTTYISIELKPRGWKDPAVTGVNSSSSDAPKLKCRIVPDKLIKIVLVPKGQEIQQEQETCGVDKSVDSERLISEWNGPYIFQLIDHSKETNQKYKTEVFQVSPVTSTSGTTTPATPTTKSKAATTTTPSSNTETTSTSSTATTDMEKNKTDEALHLLFIAPPSAGCTPLSLEKAGSGEEGFYPLFLGTSGNFSKQKAAFENETHCLQREYNGDVPLLCATKEFMREGRGNAWITTLNTLFNFPYNNERMFLPSSFSSDPCKTIDATKEAITTSNFFNTQSVVKFERSNQSVFESDGFVKASILVSKTTRKPIIALMSVNFPQTNNSASEEDVVVYDGPVVIEKNKNTAEIFIGLKEDAVDEGDELFTMSLKSFGVTRRKRGLREIASKLLQNVWISESKGDEDEKGFKYYESTHFETIISGWDDASQHLATLTSTTAPAPSSSPRLDDYPLENYPITAFQIRNEKLGDIEWKNAPTDGFNMALFKSIDKKMEEFGLKEVKEVMTGKTFKAYYFPYLEWTPKADIAVAKDELKADKNLIGWVDLPRIPKQSQPVYAFTGGMNGCTLLALKTVTKDTKQEDTSTFRVYHLNSPASIPGTTEKATAALGYTVEKQDIRLSGSNFGSYNSAKKARTEAEHLVEDAKAVSAAYSSDKTIAGDAPGSVTAAIAAAETAYREVTLFTEACLGASKSTPHNFADAVQAGITATESTQAALDAISHMNEEIMSGSKILGNIAMASKEAKIKAENAHDLTKKALEVTRKADKYTDKKAAVEAAAVNKAGVDIYIDVIKAADDRILSSDPEISTLTWQDYGIPNPPPFPIANNFLHFEDGLWWYYYQMALDTVSGKQRSKTKIMKLGRKLVFPSP